MMRKYKLIIVMIVLSTMFVACGLPIEVVSQQQAAAPTQAQPVVVQDDSSAQLLGTISALETQLADSSASSAKALEDQPSATPLPSETPVPGATAAPANVATSTSVPTATAAATATPVTPTTYPPVVYITPIQPFQPYNSPYSYQPYYPYYPAYPNQQGYPYYYGYDYSYPANYYANAPCNRATFIADVNVPDNTNFAGGTSFTKTWRLRNDGSCTWTTGYALVFDHGYALGAPSSVSIPADVPPGATIDLSVNMSAPSDSGVYQGYWKLQDASGNRFGIGRDASVAFWVKITVGSYYYNNYPYSTPYYYSQPYVSGSCEITAVSPAMYSSFDPNSDIDVKWTVRNTSGSTWQAANVDYKYISGTEMYKNSSAYDLGSDITSGATTDIVVDTKLPSSHGVYSMTWGVVDGSTRLCTMSITLYVR